MSRPAYSPERRAEIETQIRAAALRLFGRLGYRGVSLRAIAAEVDRSATALYRYYDSKEALLAAIRADGFSELQETLSTVRRTAASSIEAASAGIEAYLRFSRERPELYRLMYELDQGDLASSSEVAENRRRAFAEAVEIARGVLVELGRAGDANELAHVLWISAHGLAALALANQLDLGKDYDELVGPVAQTVLGGVLGNSEGTG